MRRSRVTASPRAHRRPLPGQCRRVRAVASVVVAATVVGTGRVGGNGRRHHPRSPRDPVSPASGGSGTVVTITGTNLTGATAVTFGPGNNATTFSVTNDTTVTATAPAGSGTVDVQVTTPCGHEPGPDPGLVHLHRLAHAQPHPGHRARRRVDRRGGHRHAHVGGEPRRLGHHRDARPRPRPRSARSPSPAAPRARSGRASASSTPSPTPPARPAP